MARNLRLFLAVAMFLSLVWPAVLLSQNAVGRNSGIEDARAAGGFLLRHLQAGQLNSAIQLGRESAERWPNDAEIRHLLVVAYFKTRQQSLAIAELQQAERLDQSNPDVHFDLALVYLDQTLYSPAADQLEKPMQLDRNNAVAYLLLAVMRERRAKLRQNTLPYTEFGIHILTVLLKGVCFGR